MNSFKDFNIKTKINSFVGDKIQVTKILNMQVKVVAFKIEPSKKKEGTDFLTLQIEKSGELRIVFTGSRVLIDQIRQVPEEKFPFTTTIRRDNEYYEFT
ncbi:MAG: hypothetical protein WDO15_11315 [Bacteroidota bacterium]